jgi:uncharacterized protein
MNGKAKFIVDENVGKLTKLMRLLGYDTMFFIGETDTQMVSMALAENRILLTRDTHILERRAITSGQVKAILVGSDDIEEQIRQVVANLHLDNFLPFTICLEDNEPLITRTREEVQDRVPPYVWETQKEYVECPKCHRIYWKGTHWDAMTRRLENIIKDTPKEKPWTSKNDITS